MNFKDEAYTELQMCSPDRYNILLLGSKGVGKTTLINTLVCHQTCEEYNSRTLSKTVISDKYCYGTSAYYISKKLNNPSSTEEPEVYQFRFKEKYYNFIDTPGFKDSIVDNRLYFKIMRALATFTQIHGIWIVLDAWEDLNSRRFTKFMSNILQMIDQDAFKNIFFVFTKNSGRQDDEEELLLQLKEKLYVNMFVNVTFRAKKKNTFFLDSEGFQIQSFHNENGREIYKKRIQRIWKRTRIQIFSMLDRVREIEPTEIRNSTAVKKFFVIREAINDLCKFVKSDIIFFNEYTLDDMAGQVKELQSAEYDVKVVKVNSKSKVCTNLSCIAIAKLANSESYTIHYNNVCYEERFMPKGFYDERKWALRAHLCKACEARGHECENRHHKEIDYEQRIFTRPTELTKALIDVYAAPDPKTAMKSLFLELKTEYATISNFLDVIDKFWDQRTIYPFKKEYIGGIALQLEDQTALQSFINRFDEIETEYEQRRMILTRKISADVEKLKFKALKERQMQEIEALSTALTIPTTIPAKCIFELSDQLFNLKYRGPMFREMYYKHYGYTDEEGKVEIIFIAHVRM